jgi:hypothetical protein
MHKKIVINEPILFKETENSQSTKNRLKRVKITSKIIYQLFGIDNLK